MSQTSKQSEEEKDDLVSRSIGEYGRWQLRLTFLLSLFNIPCTWHIFAPTFQAAERNMWCVKELSDYEHSWRNRTQPYGLCFTNATGNSREESIACEEWEFDGKGHTLITEFGLICDRKQLINVAQLMFLAGVAAGGLVGGIISDKYGRKKTLISCVFLQATIGTLIAFSPWFTMYATLRAILGFISVSVVLSGFVLSVELVGGIWRIVAGISYIFPVSVSYMTISGIAWLLQDWRQLQLAVSLPGFIFVGMWWILPESPLWLLAMGRTKEVMSILQQAAAVNHKKLPYNLEKQLLPVHETVIPKGSVMDIFKTARLRKTTFLMAIIWFSTYLVYYGLVLNLANIGGDLYVNSIISGAVEIPAIAASILVLLRMGRKWPVSLTLILSGVVCLPIPYIPTQWLATALAMIAKFLISSTNAMIPVFTAELYPTTIRNIGVGASNVTAGVALLLVPYLWETAQMHVIVPMTVLGVCGTVGGLSVLFLPETGNAPLMTTLVEEDVISSASSGSKSDNKNSQEII